MTEPTTPSAPTAGADPSDDAHGRHRVTLAAVLGAVLLAQVLVYPGVDTLVAAFGTTDALRASTWFLAVEFAAFVAFAPLWGAASDATGRRVPFVVAGGLGGAAGYLALAVAGPRLPFAAVLALRALQGAATVGAFSLSMTMLADLAGGQGRNMGAAGIAIGTGTALGAPLGGQLYEVGAVVPLYAAGALLAVVAVATALVPDRGRAGSPGHAAALSRLRARPALALPFAFGFADRLTAGFFALVGTLYFRQAFALSPGATGLLLALFFAPFALLQYPFGVLSDRVGRTGPIVAGSTLYGLALAAVGLAPSVPVAAVAMVVVGAVGALMAPATMALAADLASPGERGVALAGFNAAGSAGFLVGIVAGGLLADRYGFLAAFLSVGALELVLALVALPVLLRLGVERTRVFASDE